jgi:ribose 1,5-bisphosphokinase
MPKARSPFPRERSMPLGSLVYVMGPSGAGKDSVMAFARAACDPDRVVFAHRYITRPAATDAENHVALSEPEFAARLAAGWFVLHWESHGLRYGIGCEIDAWIASGRIVVINGSRAYLPEAIRRYPTLVPVLVTAPAEVREARLQARARASDGDLQQRLDRAVALDGAGNGIVEIDNSSTLDAAGNALLALLSRA